MAERTRGTPKGPEHLVVIGSSAGGIDALSTLLAAVPKDFPAAILVVQHLDPRRESHLAEILGRHSLLPVTSVADRESLRPGHVFIVPADRNVAITDHQVSVTEDRGTAGPRPSIDRALSSAAERYGEGLIAVILTGAGSDGAAGARLVKASGGTVIIQNPETASYPAMPSSLASTTVDVVADLEAIGPLLMDLVSGAYVPSKPSEEAALTAFLDNVREATGIDFGQYKRPTILRRLQRRMIATGNERLADYARFVQGHPDELQRLSNAFLIKVTEFFRDPDVYEYLRDQVIPALADSARQNGGELRLWSAGCSTGEEAYSLAIAAASVLGEQPDGVRLRIFATDVDAEAIDFARRGIYPASAVDQVPKDLQSRYFVHSSGQFEVAPSIRSLVAFGQHDLAQRAPFPRIDLVICRNVLIYFTNELQRRALQLFAFSLRDHGYLVLGKAETTSPLGDHFVLEQPRLKVYRRQGTRVLLTPVRGISATVGLPQRQFVRGRRGSEALGPFSTDLERARLQATRADNLIRRLPVGVVVVDRKYDIALINDAARNLLGVYGSAIGQDLIHLAQGIPGNELRRAIDGAFRNEPARAVWDIPVRESTTGEVVALEVAAYRQVDGSAPDDVVTILVRDITAERAELGDLRGSLREETSSAERLREQVGRMADAAELLRTANLELTQVNADLRSQNDDLVVSNEEVQAATEEVETLNEEMQATNEELETLNEELQATVEELNTTNDDLEARTTELQSLALSLEKQREVSEAERGRLSAVLAGMADAVIVVDKDGAPTLTNAAYDATFGNGGVTLIDDAGQPLSADDTPERRASRGEVFSMRFSVAADDSELPRSYEARGRPIDGDAAKGGVVVIRDITERNIQELQQRFVAMLSHELWTPLTGVSAYLELLERELSRAGDEKSHRYAERALAQARRFSGLVSELMDAKRLQTGRMSFRFAPVDLRAVVEEAIAVMQPLAGDRPIAYRAPRSAVTVRGDTDRLEQAVINLISNAVRHAPGSEISVGLRRRGSQAELTVSDDGPGLDAGAREQARALFHELSAATPSAGGLGLGLFITGSVVQEHGGSITVDSQPRRGATFTIRLPLASGASSGAASTRAAKKATSRQRAPKQRDQS